MIKIDGSQGEGGGQILRTSVSLAAALGESITIDNIRSNRPKPGLRPQHLHSIQTIAELSNSTTEGLDLNSTKVSLHPNNISSKNIDINIGTAGSITLLVQSLLQSISISGKTFMFTITGGTDVNWSPSADYLCRIVIPLLEKFGFSITSSIIKRGFYPKGSGKIIFKVKSPTKIKPISIIEPEYSNLVIDGIITSDSSISKPQSQIDEQCLYAKTFLEQHQLNIDSINTSTHDSGSFSSGICISSTSQNCFIGSDILETNVKQLNSLGKNCSKKFLSEYASNCTVDHHLADMIIPFLSLSKSSSQFTTSYVSSHLQTNLDLCKLITGMNYKINKKNKFCYLVSINP